VGLVGSEILEEEEEEEETQSPESDIQNTILMPREKRLGEGQEVADQT